MTTNRRLGQYAEIWPRNLRLHDQYVRATNAALEQGREDLAEELAKAYRDELHSQPSVATTQT